MVPLYGLEPEPDQEPEQEQEPEPEQGIVYPIWSFNA